MVLFVWPGRVREWHLWELAVTPYVLVCAYWLVVMRKARTAGVLDEKQSFDMTHAGALTWSLSIPAYGSSQTRTRLLSWPSASRYSSAGPALTSAGNWISTR